MASSSTLQAKQWVDWGGESDHNPIILELKGTLRRPPSPFKFNATWLKDSGFISLVHTNWIHLNMVEGSRAAVLFMENLKRVKKDTIPWAEDKKIREDAKLLGIESWLSSKMEGDGLGFFVRGR